MTHNESSGRAAVCAEQTLMCPLGTLRIAAVPQGLAFIELADGACKNAPNALTRLAAAQLAEYFCGQRTRFALPLAASGTPFQLAVWALLRELPYGQTTTYGALALQLGKPGEARAVGNAAGKNPLLLVTPCHRLLASGGLGGFSAGVARKRQLLALEGVRVSE